MRIGELLVAARLARAADIETALRTQAQYGGRLGSTLIDLGYVDGDLIAEALARQLGVPAATSAHFAAVDPAVIARLPRKAAERYVAVPFGMTRTRQLLVACRDPHDLAAIDALQVVAGMRLVVHVAPELKIQRALERYYGVPRRDDRFVRVSGPPAARLPSAPPPPSTREGARRVANPLSMPAMPAAPAHELELDAEPDLAPHPSDIPRFAPPPMLTLSAPPPPRSVPAPAPSTPPRTGDLEMFPEDMILGPVTELPMRAAMAASSMPVAHEEKLASSLPPESILGPVTEEPPAPARVYREIAAAPPDEPLHLSLPPESSPPPRSTAGARRVASGGYRAISLPPEQLATSSAPRRSDPPPTSAARRSAPPPSHSEASSPHPPASTTRARSVAPKPVLGVDETCARLSASVTKEGVGNAIAAYLRSYFDCGLVLVVKEGSAIGWRGFAPAIDDAAIEAVAVPLASASPVRAAFESKHRVIDAAGAPSMQALFKLLGVANAREVIVAPIVIRERVINLVMGVASSALPHGIGDELDRIAVAAAEAYVRLIKHAR